MAVPEHVRPLLILAHGTRTTKAQWDGYAERLPEVEVLPIDLPGHGEHQGGVVDQESVLRVFDEAVARRKPGQQVILGGHSLGGYLASMYAGHMAEQHGRHEIDALLLVGTTGDPRSAIASLYKGFAKVLPWVGFERMTTVANWFYKALKLSDDLPGPEAYSALSDSWSLVFQHCGPQNLEQVECPVVFVNGQLDQMRVHVKRFAAVANEPQVHLVKGATHVLPMTHPDELCVIVRELAQRVAADS